MYVPIRQLMMDERLQVGLNERAQISSKSTFLQEIGILRKKGPLNALSQTPERAPVALVNDLPSPYIAPENSHSVIRFQ